MVQDSTRFSPNDLVFVNKVRGLLSLLKDGLEESKPPGNVIGYVNRFPRRLLLAWKMASDNGTRVVLRVVGYYEGFCGKLLHRWLPTYKPP